MAIIVVIVTIIIDKSIIVTVVVLIDIIIVRPIIIILFVDIDIYLCVGTISSLLLISWSSCTSFSLFRLIVNSSRSFFLSFPLHVFSFQYIPQNHQRLHFISFPFLHFLIFFLFSSLSPFFSSSPFLSSHPLHSFLLILSIPFFSSSPFLSSHPLHSFLLILSIPFILLGVEAFKFISLQAYRESTQRWF